MPLRRRVTLVAAVAVAIAILLVALVSYLVVRDQLRGQVDDALSGQAILVQQEGNRALGGGLPGPPPNAGGRAPYAQVVGSDGTVLLSQGGLTLPVDSTTRTVASGDTDHRFRDVTVGGSHLRVLAIHTGVVLSNGQVQSAAVQLARPLGPVDHVLSNLRLILLGLCAGGIALAAALGRIAARRVLAPLAEVTRTAEHIGETEDLSSRLAVHADDEVGQLARRFNWMLERLQGSRSALDNSVRAQRQLVADASHELRTPVTSLRTNIEVLLESPHISEDERRRLLHDVVEQSEELSALVGDLIELARGDEPAGTPEEVRLDRIVAESVDRGRRHTPDIEFVESLEPVIVSGVPERLGRAVNNLIDNAARYSPPGSTVEVTVDPTGVGVRDHGPGIPPEDLPHVFDRFFRGQNSAGRQGSGLGLAIVKQVAEQHGGSVLANNAPDHGAEFRLRLPVLEAGTEGVNQPWEPEASPSRS